MKKPKALIEFSEKWDGWGYWPDPQFSHKWVIDVTVTYGKEMKFFKKRISWLATFPRNEEKAVINELYRYARQNKIVHVLIHKIWKPLTHEEIEYIKSCNGQLQQKQRQVA